MDSTNVILPGIAALGSEDCVLYGGCGVGGIILLDVLVMIGILKMNNLRVVTD